MSINMDTGVMPEAAALPDNAPLHSDAQASNQEHMVPLTALQAERRERQQLQENMKMLQDHVELLRSNQMQMQSSKIKTEHDSRSDDDVLTYGEAKKFISEMKREQDLKTAELQIQHQYSDYTETVKKYLPEAIKENPKIRDWIMNSPNPYEQAYYLAKKSDAYLKEKVAHTRSPEAQQVALNMQRTGNLSAVGTSAPASQVSSWKNMSDQDFMKTVNRNLGYS